MYIHIYSAWIRRLGVRFPLKLRYFLSKKFRHFHKNTRSCVGNECCCPRAVNISNVNLTSKISIPPEPGFNNMAQQMSDPDSIRHESEGLGFESPSGRDIYCLKKFDTFTRTPLRVSKINAVAPRTANISNVNFTSKISIPPEAVFKWLEHSAWIRSLVVRAPPHFETFSVSKTLTLSREHPFMFRNECCYLRTVNISNVNVTSKICISWYVFTNKNFFCLF